MATKSDIQGWIWNAQGQYNRYKQIVADCDKQIARLEPVYQALGEIKADFSSARNSTGEVFDQKGVWRGEQYSSFCRSGTTLDGTCGEYYKRLDAAHDAVNVKIGEYKAKKRELIPIIGSLWAQITQWRIDIENALN